jgi:hypothetical protein
MGHSDRFDLPEPPEDILWFLGSLCFLTAAVMATLGMQGNAPEILLLAGLACFCFLTGLTGLEVAVNALVVTAGITCLVCLFSLGLFTHGLPPLQQWLSMIAAFATVLLFVIGLLLEELVRYMKRRYTTAGIRRRPT